MTTIKTTASPWVSILDAEGNEVSGKSIVVAADWAHLKPTATLAICELPPGLEVGAQ